MVNASGPEFLAHHPGQGAAIGLGDVRYLEEGGIQLVACAQGRDQGDVQLQGSLCQIQLAGHQIDGDHDVIVPGSPPGRSSPDERRHRDRGQDGALHPD